MFSQSFPPLADRRARVLILGSMPGVASLNAQQYYAHARNAFWPLMWAILHNGSNLDAKLPAYKERLRLLQSRGIALWDVLQSCYREGSLDSSIEEDTIVGNDFSGLFATTPELKAVFFNGAKAQQSFDRYVQADVKRQYAHLSFIRLPSTSPAHAAISVQEKLQQWQIIKNFL